MSRPHQEDVHGKRQTLPSGDCKRVHKRYYRKKEEHVYQDWTVEHAVLIQRELLDKRKKAPSLWTFIKYRPNNIEKGGGHLTQMVCDGCTEFRFLYQALLRILRSLHQCTKTTCPGYRAPMGTKCTCPRCRNCVIQVFLEKYFQSEFEISFFL